MLRRRVCSAASRSILSRRQHLSVAVLFDYVDHVVLLHEIVNFAGERIGAQTQIVSLDVVFLAQLVAAPRSVPSAKCRIR